jgi:hypothetical protein
MQKENDKCNENCGEILAALPKDRLSPESTEGKRGFIHPVRLRGIAEKCTIDFIIRDFETKGLAEKRRLPAYTDRRVDASLSQSFF